TGTGTDKATSTDAGAGAGAGTATGAGTVPGCLRPTLSAVLKGFGGRGGGATLTEKDFSALKRKEVKQAQEADTVSMMLHHAFYLVLPYQPFSSHHFMWGRFMRFVQKTGLRTQIARYHTEAIGAGRTWVDADSQGFFPPDVGARSSAQEPDGFRRQVSSPAASASRGVDGSGGGGSGHVGGGGGGGGGVDGSRHIPDIGGRDQDLRGSRLPPARPRRRQLACHLLKPMYMDHAAFQLALFNE
ncbi:unnamed protein product, partial [Laminaria digitata]